MEVYYLNSDIESFSIRSNNLVLQVYLRYNVHSQTLVTSDCRAYVTAFLLFTVEVKLKSVKFHEQSEITRVF